MEVINFEPTDAENIPFGFSNYSKVREIQGSPEFQFLNLNDFNTQFYMVYGYYRPISKILDINELNNVL